MNWKLTLSGRLELEFEGLSPHVSHFRWRVSQSFLQTWTSEIDVLFFTSAVQCPNMWKVIWNSTFIRGAKCILRHNAFRPGVNLSCNYLIVFHDRYQSQLKYGSSVIANSFPSFFVFELSLQQHSKYAFHVHVTAQASSGNGIVIYLDSYLWTWVVTCKKNRSTSEDVGNTFQTFLSRYG